MSLKRPKLPSHVPVVQEKPSAEERRHHCHAEKSAGILSVPDLTWVRMEREAQNPIQVLGSIQAHLGAKEARHTWPPHMAPWAVVPRGWPLGWTWAEAPSVQADPGTSARAVLGYFWSELVVPEA